MRIEDLINKEVSPKMEKLGSEKRSHSEFQEFEHKENLKKPDAETKKRKLEVSNDHSKEEIPKLKMQVVSKKEKVVEEYETFIPINITYEISSEQKNIRKSLTRFVYDWRIEFS
ncbi:hypothetical protein C1645_739898 [Glomus cerebriforme]|uniref:Uncharacterized protein n=1 Tax=Glomus cerebriforme TaxID=658196 RepID=A0A397SNN7_9GLOM|nr:hypothetical protein C1645_739898 [Glomus cerebriforme]